MSDKMSPAVSEVCSKIKKLLGNGRRTYARAVYAAGVELLFVKDTPGALDQIAGELGYTKNTLRKYIRLAKTWSAERFAVISAEWNSRQMPMSASHFLRLTEVTDAKRREALRKKCINEGLSVAHLTLEIYAKPKLGLAEQTRENLKNLALTKNGGQWLETLFESFREGADLKSVVEIIFEARKG